MILTFNNDRINKLIWELYKEFGNDIDPYDIMFEAYGEKSSKCKTFEEARDITISEEEIKNYARRKFGNKTEETG